MKKSQFTDQQIAFAVQQAEAGVAVEEVCRKLGVSEQTFYRWKKKFAGYTPFSSGVAAGFSWSGTESTPMIWY